MHRVPVGSPFRPPPRHRSGHLAIGPGEDVLADVLTEVTGDAARVFVAPGPAELAAIYRAVASGIVCR